MSKDAVPDSNLNKRMSWLFHSFLFTIVMSVSLIGFAIATSTYLGPVSQNLLKWAGFSPLHIPQLEWHRIITSVFFTVGGWKFYASFLMLIFCVGLTEFLYGTRNVILLFWLSHISTLLCQSLLLAIPLHQLDVWWGTLLATRVDVGPSAGYYGCLGASCLYLNKSLRTTIVTLIVVFLAIRLGMTITKSAGNNAVSFGADLAHLLAFPIGMLLASYCVRSKKNSRNQTNGI